MARLGLRAKRWLLGIAAAVSVTAVTGSHGADPALGPGLEAQGWQLFSHPNWDAARFSLTSDGAVRVSTDNSTALIFREIATADRNRRRLSWRWRVDETMPPTDIRVKGGDDRPLALHVWFEEDPDRTTILTRLADGLLESLFGVPVSGNVLTYVWGGRGWRGEAQPNPHIGERSWMIVLRPGTAPTGRWFTESVDLAADFERAFGYAPRGQRLVAIAADSEDTMTRSVAHIADIRFAD